MVRQRSAKPSFAGSIPAVASSFRISPPSGFSFENTVESHGWYRLAPFRWSSGVLSRPEVLTSGVADVDITMKRGKIEIGGAPRVSRGEVEQRVTRMLQLHVDTSEFLALAGRSPSHTWVVETSFGRLLCGSTLFEDIVKIIATTNTMWRQTVRMVELLVEKNPAIAEDKVAEATLRLKGVTLRARESSGDLEHSVDLVADKLARQVKRHRDKRRKRSQTRRLIARVRGRTA